MPAGKQVDPQAQLTLDDVDNLALNLSLGRGGEALHRRYPGLFPSCELADEADGVEVVGAEIMPPFGQTVGLVKDPGPNLALADQIDKPPVAQLLGRDVENADIAQADPFLDLAPLRQGEQAIDAGRNVGAGLAAEIVDLVFHQGLKQIGRAHV